MAMAEFRVVGWAASYSFRGQLSNDKDVSRTFNNLAPWGGIAPTQEVIADWQSDDPGKVEDLLWALSAFESIMRTGTSMSGGNMDYISLRPALDSAP